MAYNYFPAGYQPYYPTQNNVYPTQMNVAPTQPTQNNLIWVQGEAGAKSYLVAPNTTVQLWDSENQVIYLKSADASGMPSMKVLDYRIRESAPTAQQAVIGHTQAPAEYVTRDELAVFEKRVQAQIAGLTKQEEKDDEQPFI